MKLLATSSVLALLPALVQAVALDVQQAGNIESMTGAYEHRDAARGPAAAPNLRARMFFPWNVWNKHNEDKDSGHGSAGKPSNCKQIRSSPSSV
ncbi:hypothetical protein PYCC9005_003083 [Savitreella phatthalungensis]